MNKPHDIKLAVREGWRQRMYCLVLRQLSPMQKGVQAAHAVVEYSNAYGDTPEWEKWSKTDKTIIILDGGTAPGMDELACVLDELQIPYAVFREEDLNGLTTAVALIADERVWDRAGYPEWDGLMETRQAYEDDLGGYANAALRELLGGRRLAQ